MGIAQHMKSDIEHVCFKTFLLEHTAISEPPYL